MGLSFQIKCCNVDGMGVHKKNTFRQHPTPPKIKELVSSAKHVPTLFCTLETQLRSDHRYIKLPKNVRYLKETSGNEFARNGGIFIFGDSMIQVENKNLDLVVIQSMHSIYTRVKYLEYDINVISVYLPHQTRRCVESLNIIDKFISEKQLTNFVIIGDFNTSFESQNHTVKAQNLSKFLNKYCLFDIATRLGLANDYTWRGRGNRIASKSRIDFAFANFDLFNSIEYTFNSFSDHKTITIGIKKKFVYTPPKWKHYLFKNPEFIDLMKSESVKFLALNSDQKILPDNVEEIWQQTAIEKLDFSFNDLEFKSTSALFSLVRYLKSHHDKFYSKIRLKYFQKTKEFDKQLSKLYSILDKSDNLDKQHEIKQMIQTQQEYFKKLVYSGQENSFIKSINLDGNSNSLTYRHIKKNKRINYNLLINGQKCNSPQEIANIFAQKHADIVSRKFKPISNLEQLLEDYDLSLESIYPQIKCLSSPYSSTKEYKEVIDSMSSTSSPGISSEPKSLYKFLFDFLPTFSTEAFNGIYDVKDIEKSPFRFLKDKNVIFIPKKDVDQSNPSNYRPISLCEVPYKILTKAINRKVKPYLCKILDSEQFGFTPTRHMATASHSILASFEYIKENNINAQFLSVDIEKAYDKCLISVVDKIIRYIFPEGHFAEGWIKLTNGGRFRASVSNYVSKFYDVIVSISQGRPDAPTQFNFLHKIFMACLESAKIKKISLKVNDNYIPCGAFADDTWKFLQMKNEDDVHIIRTLLHKMEQGIGLKVNFKKTRIITYGKEPPGLENLGLVCSYIKHLGIYIGFDGPKCSEMSYNELIEKMERKAKGFPMKYGFSILKRRNVCMAILNSMAYHIYRIYAPSAEHLSKLSKVINKFIWSVDKIDSISYRFKVASSRIEADLVQGGLNLLKSENQCFKIWLPSFIHCLKHASTYVNSTLRIFFDFRNLAVGKLLNNFGFHTWQENAEKLRLIQPNTNDSYLSRAKNFFLELEEDKQTILYTPISSCSYFSKCGIEYFSEEEEQLLIQKDMHTLVSLLSYNEVSKTKVLIIPVINSDINSESFNLTLINKIKSIVTIIKEKFPIFDTIHKAKFKKMRKTLLQFSANIYGFHFKRIIKKSKEKHHPAIKTRRNDSIYFPDVEMYEISFKKLFSLPIMLYYKSFFFEQISRTLISRNKLAKFSKNEQSNMCPKCHKISNLEHELFHCIFPDFFSNTLAKFLDIYFCDGRPEFIFLRENFFMFNIYYEVFSNIEYLQISLLILVAKDRSLKLCKDERIEKFNQFNCISQSLIITQFTSKLLSSANLNDNLITAFGDFITDSNMHD